MPLPLEDHVRQVLLENDRGVKFHRAVADGWGAFSDEYPQRNQWRRKSTSRHIVWEEIVKRLVQATADDPDVVIVEHRDTMSLVVENEVLFRLKHADTSLLTKNYPTEEAQEFDDHSVDLYGFTGLQRVKLCYVPDQYETNLIWTGIAASYEGQFLWKIELDSVGAIEAPVQLPLAEPEYNTSKLAKLKKSEASMDKKKKNDGL